jgi:hypothetical protein
VNLPVFVCRGCQAEAVVQAQLHEPEGWLLWLVCRNTRCGREVIVFVPQVDSDE